MSEIDETTTAATIRDIARVVNPPTPPASFTIPVGLPAEPSNRFVRDRDIMLRYMEGQSPAEIADAKELTTDRVRQILGSKYVREELQRLATLANDRYVQERIDALTIEALDKVRDTMRGQNNNELQFKAAKEILDKNPLLKQKTNDDAMKELGAGLGEAIITRLSQQDAERRAANAATPRSIDVTPETKNDPSTTLSTTLFEKV